jgi:ribonuclease HI
MKHWAQPTNTVVIEDGQVDAKCKIEAFTDGSREQGVESGIVIYIDNNLIDRRRYTLNENRSNKKAEQLAYLKKLEYIQQMNIKDMAVRVVHG